jgi:hypothetical protein
MVVMVMKAVAMLVVPIVVVMKKKMKPMNRMKMKVKLMNRVKRKMKLMNGMKMKMKLMNRMKMETEGEEEEEEKEEGKGEPSLQVERRARGKHVGRQAQSRRGSCTALLREIDFSMHGKGRQLTKHQVRAQLRMELVIHAS